MQRVFVLTVIALAALACTMVSAQDNSWDFFVLAQQWPGGYPTGTWPACATTFTMHGLWPTRNDSSYPEQCTTQPFSLAKLGTLVNTMNCQWPSYSGPYSEFWSHEWTTHGTCALTDSLTSTEYDFFNAALQMHTAAGITAALATAGITPSAYTSYQAGDIRAAIVTALGVTPIAGCEDGNLVTMQVCVDKTLAFIQCPEVLYQSDSCGSDYTAVYYNPIPAQATVEAAKTTTNVN